MADELTDANDLARVAGPEAVRALVDAAQPVKPPAARGWPEFEDVVPSNAQAHADTPAPEEWPDPVLPGTRTTPPIPASILPSWAGAMVEAVADSTQTPPALAVMSTLAVLATVLQRRYEVAPLGCDYTEPLCLWTVSASPPGTRKSAVLGATLGPLLRWEKLHADRMRRDIAKVNAQRAVAKRRIERLLQDAAKAKDSNERESIQNEIQHEELNTPEELRAPRLFTSDSTPERLQALLAEHGERMATHSDESGSFQIMAGLYSGGQANLDVYLMGHAGSPMRVDRATRSVHLDRPALSFGLMVQPGTLADVAGSKRFRDSGLLARFLWCVPDSTVGTRDVRRHAPIPPHVKEAYERGIFGLLEGWGEPVGKPRVLQFTDPARELWFTFAQHIEDNQGEGGQYEAISDWTSKLPGQLARVAAVFELAEMGLTADEVSEVAMRNALQLGRLLIEHARAAFSLLGTDAVDTDAVALVRWIKAEGREQFTRREAQKAQEGRFRSGERLDKALDRLVDGESLREFKLIRPGMRPSKAYRVNPGLLSS
ncbi:MAG: YfjI family protein [Hydrogenophaga sp.]|uniref:YfjI family protein n=1 Tax=Hydrogenophaga sp. TaxID=1904254 RepID=UPI00271BB4DC|nr:YfjI family protein [Hydrogenophaga sp.]MDO9569020.1 YfjI family protein [Hydrogenophaga sp.]